MAAGEGEAEDGRYRVKPMSCPMHILVYASQQRSYRDLPVRLAEIANVYRNERSGTLHGKMWASSIVSPRTRSIPCSVPERSLRYTLAISASRTGRSR